MAAVVLAAAACSSPGAPAPVRSATAASTGPAKAVIPPETPAGAQLRWLIEALARLPLSDAQIRAHFDAAFLAQASPAVLNQALEAVVSIELLSIQVSQLSTLVASASTGGVVQRAQV